MCEHKRVIEVNAKCSDLCSVTYIKDDGKAEPEQDVEYGGYVPKGLNIGEGDYINFQLCLDCGKNLGAFPIEEEIVTEALSC